MKIVINRTDAIGDCLLTTPLARLLKHQLKDCHITFLVSPRSGELINLCEGVDQVLIYDPKWSFFKRLSFLKTVFKENQWDCFFHLGGALLPIFVSWLVGVKTRGGLQSKWATFLFLNKAMRQSRRLVTMHESDYNLELAKVLGVYAQGERPEKLAPKLRGTQEEAKRVRASLGIQEDETLAVIHPGMSGHTLNWASRNYGRLIQKLAQDHQRKFRFVVSFTPSDGPYLEGMRDFLSQVPELENQVIFYDGSQKGIIEYTKLLKGADLFIGPSTGTTHMANALGTPQVALYSPIKVQSALRWGPYIRDNKVKIMVPDVVCGESVQCAGASCPYYECMAKIEVEEVVQASQAVLEKRG